MSERIDSGVVGEHGSNPAATNAELLRRIEGLEARLNDRTYFARKARSIFYWLTIAFMAAWIIFIAIAIAQRGLRSGPPV